MDTATFFEKFSLFAQAEDAATRFREVVLNLAFSGRLKGTDLQGWETHPIGDFFTEGLKSINAPESPNQTYELWSVPSFETRAPEIVTGSQVGSTKRELRDGTILLGKINPHLNRIWVVNRRTNHPMIASQEWINVTAGDKWDTGYLARLLSSPSFNRSVCATAQGMGSLTRANTKQVAQIVVHCPPLKEQQKLIAKVDELMALCDRLEAQLKERDVKQAALTKAALAKFTEDPTPENLQLLFHPSFSIEPEALRRLLLNLATSGNLNEGKKSKPSIVSMDSLVGRKGLKNGLSPTSSATQTKYKCLALSSIKRNYVDCTEGKPIDIDAETAEPFLIQPSDVFIIRGNGSKDRVGIAGMATSSPGNVIFPDLFIRVSLPKELIDPEYFLCAWNSPSNREALMSLSTTTSGIWKVNQGHITSCKIPVPDLSEQRHIVKRVKEITSLIDQLEAQFEASRTTGEKLLEAMVAELTSA